MNNYGYSGREGITPVVKYLIIVNVAVFVAQLLLNGSIGLTTNFLAMQPFGSGGFKAYQVITHMFAHGGIFHIFMNMFGLYMFGREMESLWGSKRFLNFYLICGIGAAIVNLVVEYLLNRYSFTLGASGAVIGVFAAYAFTFPNRPLFLMFIPIPIKAKYLMMGLVAYDLYGGLKGNDGIAHFAHLGGVLTASIMVWIWNQNRSRFY